MAYACRENESNTCTNDKDDAMMMSYTVLFVSDEHGSSASIT